MPRQSAAVPRHAPIWLGLLILYLVWGSTYLGIAIAVDTIPPFLMAAVRFLIAGLSLLTWSVAHEGRAFRAPSLREWRDSAIVGTLLLGGGMGMVAYGEQSVPSGITALIIALMPVWVAVLGRLFLREKLPRMAVGGIILGFVGVAILIGPSAFGGTGAFGHWRSQPSSSRRSRGPAARFSRHIARLGPGNRSSPRVPRCSPAVSS
jgi:drug/metabolite transporter (DMT)-like permease